VPPKHLLDEEKIIQHKKAADVNHASRETVTKQVDQPTTYFRIITSHLNLLTSASASVQLLTESK
jgi:hypothetical protein